MTAVSEERDAWRAMKERLPSFLVPLLTAVVLLYQVLTNLQIAVTHPATLFVIGTILAIAAVAGALAAFGPPVVRVGVLTGCTLVFLDVTLHLSAIFDRLSPEKRERVARDQQRIADLHRIQSALDQYLTQVGPLPMPEEYGETAGREEFWKNWWDTSTHDGDRDGLPFLDFLVEEGILRTVPVDPVNQSPVPESSRRGKQYVYLLIPADYSFAGGTCDSQPNRWHYMLAITDLESEKERPPKTFSGSGCACLWRDQPNYFQRHFDYVLCGSFEATPESRAAAAQARAKRAAEALAEKKAAALRMYGPQDQRRVADLLEIQKGLQRYLARFGPLPTPVDYGEAEASKGPGFWQRYWDVSAEDGDHDGNSFLDFLVESGTMKSVPVDPDNEPSPDGDPRGGRQYVYFVASPNETFGGGLCDSRKNQWIYMLGITDLRSEVVRPPRNIAGSGCECLWRNQPNYFQQQFDYVVCGRFEATPESIARAAEARAKRATEIMEAEALARKRAEEALLAKRDAAARVHEPQDRRRVAGLLRIREALQTYLQKFGSLPLPREYGEAEVSKPGFWQGYWDVSAEDGDKDGIAFLDFLVDSSIVKSVPVDPDNEPARNRDPRGGRQYVYFLASPREPFAGGSCATNENQWVYMLGITDLRSALNRPPKNFSESGCECLWRDQPNFFQQHFDYVVCGTFETTPEHRARAAEALAKRTADAVAAKRAAETLAAKQAEEALAEKRAAEARAHAPRDRRRVADLLKIQRALQTFLETVGPLPSPADYGESEASKSPGFWKDYWDVSGEDGDRDGKPFLDFLVDSNIMKTVPVDPDNRAARDGDPRGGRQYLYFVVPPDHMYQGGSCAAADKEWVYMLGITDLQSELTRPPKNITGSGCKCLWRDQPDYFQQHFDYVICGKFRR